MPRCACTYQAYSCQLACVSLCVSLFICTYVCNSDFSKVAKNQALVNAVQAQCDNISKLIVLDF